MNNGFYDLSQMSTAALKKFYKDAILYGYDIHLEYIPKWTRERYHGSSIMEFIDKFCSKSSHNVCIDRKMYGDKIEPVGGEIGFSTLTSTKNDPEFLYIFTTIENLNKLVNKYNLKLR